MKVFFHGLKFIQYAPIYLVTSHPNFSNFEFISVNDQKFLNPNYEISDEEIHIFLVGQDVFLQPMYHNNFVNILTLIDQIPINVIESTINSTNDFAIYEPGNSFHQLVNSFLLDPENKHFLNPVDAKISILNDSEFRYLYDGKARYTITWNPWKVKDFLPNVKKISDLMPIKPFGWTCLITKVNEIEDEKKLHYLSILAKQIILECNLIYNCFENNIYKNNKYAKIELDIIKQVEDFVESKDKGYVREAIKILSKNKIWIRNSIHADEKLYDFTDYLLNKSKTQVSEIRRHAIQSAISQVLARNMSHNIGSHVSYRATNIKVKKRAEGFARKITKEEAFDQWLDYFSEKLDKYEIHRNEYLSDFDQSPKFAHFYKDIIIPLCENVLIMDNLTAGEQLNYENATKNRLKIHCKIDGQEISMDYPDLVCMLSDVTNNREVNYPNNFPYLLKHRHFDEANPEKNSLEAAINVRRPKGSKDIEICLHNEQALYSILENFIRNSAKHKPQDSGDGLSIILDLHTAKGTQGYHTLYLYDESSSINMQELFDKEDNNALYQRIKQSLLDDSGKSRRANWGFADMKINSFLLFNRVDTITDDRLAENFDLVLVDQQGDQQPVFTTVDESRIEGPTDKKYRFGYKIKLSVARKILWIGEFLPNVSLKDFNREGLVCVGNFVEAISIPLDEGLMAFQFVVFNISVDYEQYLKFEEKLPGRILLMQPFSQKRDYYSRAIEVTGEINNNDIKEINQLLGWCWQQWLIGRNENLNLFIHFTNIDVNNQWEGQGVGKISLVAGTQLTLLGKGMISKIDNAKTNIIYDHHGQSFNQIAMTSVSEDVNFVTKHSLIYFGKGSEDFSTLNYPPAQREDREFLLYQAMDAATTNFFVIDERISEYASDKKPGNFHLKGVEIENASLRNSVWSMYAAGKVFVIHALQNNLLEASKSVCNVGKALAEADRITLDITNQSFEIKTKVVGLEQLNNIRKDVLIIHRTYLDKEKIGMDPNLFLNAAKREFGVVFVTSGGGYPHNLSLNCKFIPFSTLESCLNTKLSKTKLNNIIQSTMRL